VTIWETEEPLVHRVPVPEVLVLALVGAAVGIGEWEFAAVLLGAFDGLARIGEFLKAHRRDLLLPSDLLTPDVDRSYLVIGDPKSCKRGGGRSQHLLIWSRRAVKILSRVFGESPPDRVLFSGGARRFRALWDSLLAAFDVKPELHVTPGGIRGGAAVAAYRRNVAIEDIRWRMRVRSHDTLRHYLQEVTAQEVLPQISKDGRARILAVSKLGAAWDR